MKKRWKEAFRDVKSLSKPLLLASFFAGYLLSTMLLTFFGNQMQHFLQAIFS